MKLIFLSFFLQLFFFFTFTYSQNNSLIQKKDNTLSIWDVQLNINVTGTGAVKDGTFFYVSDNTSNLIRAYDVSGNYLYTFAIPGVSGLGDLAFDGTFEYGGIGTQVIYQMNFPTQTLIGTISTPIAVRFIAYDSNNDAFWIGTWNQPIMLISRSGVVLNTIDVQLPAIGGIAYDGQNPGGPYLWIFTGGSPDSLMIYQYNLSTGSFTGVSHDVLSDIGIGQTNATPGGLFFMDQFVSGTYSLGGVLVGNPTKLFVYEVNIVIPVELVSFTANIKGDKIELNWTTSTETNNEGFAVEKKVSDQHSINNGQWEEIAFVQGNGTTTFEHTYTFEDNNISQDCFVYRLKQIDYDGAYQYSHSVEVNALRPTEFSLSQNYPNPFNPVTTIKYSIPSEGATSLKHVQLKVYDILGNEIVTLVNKYQLPGEYEIKFDGSGLASGLYFYRLISGNFVQTRKLILLK